jgi:D-amino-acid oxidase
VPNQIAIVGAGISGLTCGIAFAERGYRTAIFAEQIGQETTSGAAAALWFPYDCEPRDKVIPWALATYNTLVDLCHDPRSGVSMIELCQFSRADALKIPDWALPLGARPLSVIPSGVEESLNVNSSAFKAGFAMNVPLMDSTLYLPYLATRFIVAGGLMTSGVHFESLEDVDRDFDLIINCAGIGARELARDADLEPHRGQVAIVPKIDNLHCAIVCDDDPLMYAIPRTNDCLFGGTNEVSDKLAPDPKSTDRIIAECARVLKIADPPILAERVGLRPFRKSGVRLEQEKLSDGRIVIHNYGHGGSGFTLSWGCAEEVWDLCR